MTTRIKILRNDRSTPPGKLADAELHFEGGELDGLKLIGFAVWQRREDPIAQDRLRVLGLRAYLEQEHTQTAKTA